jgi:hypothetical protein
MVLTTVSARGSGLVDPTFWHRNCEIVPEIIAGGAIGTIEQKNSSRAS